MNSTTLKLLEDVFEAYASPKGGSGDEGPVLDGPQWDTFCLECKLVEGDLDLSALQNVYATCVPSGRMTFVLFIEALSLVAERKFGASDSIARIVYFKIVRFGRTSASGNKSANASAPAAAPGSGDSAGQEASPVRAKSRAELLALHRQASGPYQAFTSNGTLLVSVFQHYADAGRGLSLRAFSRLVGDAGLCPDEISTQQVRLLFRAGGGHGEAPLDYAGTLRALAATAQAAFGGAGRAEEGQEALVERLRSPAVRERVFGEAGALGEEAQSQADSESGHSAATSPRKSPPMLVKQASVRARRESNESFDRASSSSTTGSLPGQSPLKRANSLRGAKLAPHAHDLADDARLTEEALEAELQREMDAFAMQCSDREVQLRLERDKARAELDARLAAKLAEAEPDARKFKLSQTLCGPAQRSATPPLLPFPLPRPLPYSLSLSLPHVAPPAPRTEQHRAAQGGTARECTEACAKGQARHEGEAARNARQGVQPRGDAAGAAGCGGAGGQGGGG